ncbi:MAG: hypothetical protein NZT61_05655 [Deltaproteobacteria bacterium]|nr:hypothetical protein [Deltaproteobacteria bacterium]
MEKCAQGRLAAQFVREPVRWIDNIIWIINAFSLYGSTFLATAECGFFQLVL